MLFGALTVVGYAVYALFGSVAAIFAGLLLVMAWPSLGLPATFAVIGEELQGASRIRGFTAQAVVKRIPILIAPPLGGLLLERRGFASGIRLGVMISILIAIPTLIFLWRALKTADAVPRTARASHRARLHPSLRQLLIADCLVRLCEGLPDVFLVVWALEVVRVTPVQFGFLTSILMGTAILSYAPAAALAGRVENKPFVLLTYVFFTAFPLAVVLSRSFAGLAAAYCIGGLREIGEPARKALIVDLADSESARTDGGPLLRHPRLRRGRRRRDRRRAVDYSALADVHGGRGAGPGGHGVGRGLSPCAASNRGGDPPSFRAKRGIPGFLGLSPSE